MPVRKQDIPVGFTLSIQDGPDGKPDVVLMLQCGAVTAAMAIPPDVADAWAQQMPRLLIETAAEARRQRGEPDRSTQTGGLLTATADTLVHLNRAARRGKRPN